MEKKIHSENIYNGKIIKVFKDTVELPDGKETQRDVVRHNGGVCVAAIDENNKIMVVRQYRYPYAKEILELPAGKLEIDENHYDAALRELEEETGYSAKKLDFLGELYPTVGYCDEIIYLYAAVGLTESVMKLDEDEFLNCEKIDFSLVYNMVLSGEIKDSKTQVLILKAAALGYGKTNNPTI